jgi:hypothetical protein
MRDCIRRFLIAIIKALCISLLFLGGPNPEAQTLSLKEQTSHWIWPSNGVITDVFGSRNGAHKGIDIAAQSGSPIYAVDGGIVSKSYYSQSYGNVVFIKHQDNFETVYAHLNKRNVSEGQAVKQGEIIGHMGNSGDSLGVHLHFEIHEREWTFEKQNALNPVLALGDVVVGNTITESPNARVLEVAARLHSGHNDSSASSQQSNTERVHIVQQGETLWAISRKTNTTVDALKKRNHLNSDVIVPKQKLIVH